MPKFAYRAKKGPNDVLNGVVEAVTEEAAIDQLSEEGLIPVMIRELKPNESVEKEGAAAPTQTAPLPKALGNVHFSRRIKSSDITIFSRQLATLLKSGVPILRAFWILSEQTENSRFKAFLIHAQDEIKNGNPVSSVLAEYPKLFPSIYLAMIRTGEDSGTLQEALLRVSVYRQKQEAVLSQIRTAMAYPALMALTGIGTVTFMLVFVVPRLTNLFTSMGEHLPLPTQILIGISNVLRQKWLLAILILLVVGAALFVRLKATQCRRIWSRISLRLPIVRGFILKSELARFARTLDLLIKSGVPILKAIEITAPVLSNVLLREEFDKTRRELAEGGSFGQSLKQSKFFPLFMTNLISVGEESGKLDEAMDEIASFYERETEEAVKILTSLLEPLMILVMGVIVGFIVIAMLLPMFELNLAVK